MFLNPSRKAARGWLQRLVSLYFYFPEHAECPQVAQKQLGSQDLSQLLFCNSLELLKNASCMTGIRQGYEMLHRWPPFRKL